jgi:Na+/glutamate symporter
VARQGEEAALGTHIGLIALSVFVGYLLNLSLKFVELNREFLRNHHLISGIRLFKICMLAAVCCVLLARRVTTIRFKSDWFHRLAGFSLDLMATAAISSIRFDYYKKVKGLSLIKAAPNEISRGVLLGMGNPTTPRRNPLKLRTTLGPPYRCRTWSWWC